MENSFEDDGSIEYAAVFDAERWKIPSSHIVCLIILVLYNKKKC